MKQFMENESVKILLIDDNKDNLITLKALICELFLKAKVYTALKGSIGLEIAANELPNVILLDVIMPEMDGFDVCKKLKSDKTLKDIPVVFITAIKDDKETRIKALEVGVDAFIAKPIDDSELFAQLKVLLKLDKYNRERFEKEKTLNILVKEKTKELTKNHLATLNLLEDLKEEINQRKKTELILQESEQNLKTAEITAKFGNWKLDLKTKTFEVSEGAAKIYGLTNQNVSLDEVMSLRLPQYNDMMDAAFSRLINEGKIYNIEYKIKRKNDGKIIDVHTKADYNNMGNILFGTVQDITEYKHINEALHKSHLVIKQSEFDLAQAQSVGKIGSWKWDILNSKVTWSDEMYRIFGIDKFKFNGRLEDVIKNVIHPDDLYVVLPSNAEKFANKKYNEYRIILHDNSIRNILAIAGETIFDKEGNPTFLTGIAQDITDRKKIEEEIKSEHENVFRILEATNAGTWVWNMQTGEMKFNERWANIIGYTLDEISPTSIETWIDYAHPEDLITSNSLIEKHIKGELEYYEFESRMKHKNGHWIWVLDRGKITKWSDDGKPLIMQGTHQEITERKKNEIALILSEQNLKQSEIVAKFGNWRLNIQENIIYSSIGAQKIYGTNKEKMSVDELKKFRLPEYDSILDDAMLGLLKFNQPYDIEFKIKREGDGKIVDIHSKAEYDSELGTVFGVIQDITDFKIKEIAIKDSAINLIQGERIAKTGNWKLFVDDNILHVSEGVKLILGIDKNEIPFDEFKHSCLTAYQSKFNDSIDFVINGGKSSAFELKVKHFKTGKIIDILSLLELDESTLNVFGIVMDITEQKDLSSKNKIFSQTIEQSFVSIIITDTFGDIEYVNPRFTESTGYTFEEVVGKNPRFLKTGNTSLKEYEKIWETIISGKSWQGEFLNKKKNGEVFWESAVISPMLNELGQIINFLSVKLDITQSKSISEKLKHNEQKFRSVTQSAHDGIISTGKNGDIIGWNKGAMEIFGYREEEINGNKLNAIIPSIFLDSKIVSISNLLKIGDDFFTGKTIEAKAIHKFGNEFPVDLSLAQWETNEGMFFTIIVRDISERKKSEIYNKKITDDIIQRNKDLEQFTYIVSHNLRAPVANIKGFNDILNTIELNEFEKEEMLKGISTSVHKLDDVISDLNYILQVKQHVNEKKEIVNFTELINDLTYSLGLKTNNNDIVILSDFGEVEEMNTLKSYMNSIFYNIISNSIKYKQTEVNSVIEVSSRKEDNTLFLKFKDNGLGIDMKKDGGKIFALYKRFHTQHAEGKGVGMFMVKTQVEALGGQISVTSEVNKGTEILIKFNL